MTVMTIPILEIPVEIDNVCQSYYAPTKSARIETFFKDAKIASSGLGEYQMRKLDGIKSHWRLVFTSAVILELMRWRVYTEKKGLKVSELSFGDLKRRAFGQTMRAIIRKVLEYGRDGVPEEQAFALLQV
jgi:hypothetical protein